MPPKQPGQYHAHPDDFNDIPCKLDHPHPQQADQGIPLGDQHAPMRIPAPYAPSPKRLHRQHQRIAGHHDQQRPPIHEKWINRLPHACSIPRRHTAIHAAPGFSAALTWEIMTRLTQVRACLLPVAAPMPPREATATARTCTQRPGSSRRSPASPAPPPATPSTPPRHAADPRATPR